MGTEKDVSAFVEYADESGIGTGTPALEPKLEPEQAMTFKVDFKFVMSVLSLLVAYEGGFFLLSLTAPVASIINKDLGPVAYSNWISIAYTMSAGTMISPAGRLMDIWGRRYIIIGGTVICSIGCIIGGTANSVLVVIVGIGIGGIGAAIQQQSTACIAELFPRKHRPASNGAVAISTILGGGFGSPIAYSIATKLSWRWAFWISLMTNGIGLVGIIIFYHPPTFEQKHRAEGITKMQELARFDWGGLLIFVGAIVSLLLGISWGGSSYPWKSAGTIVPIIMGLAGLVGFGFWETRSFVHEPLVPSSLVKDIRGFDVVLVNLFVGGMLLYSLISFWPLQVQTMYTSDLMEVGWVGMTTVCGTVLGALILGFSIRFIGHARVVFVVSVALMTGVIACLAAMTPNTYSAAVAVSFLGATCIGFVQVISSSMIITRVEDRHIGIAYGLGSAARLVGGSVATAVYGSVLQNTVAANLPVNVAQAVLPLGFPSANLGPLIEALVGGSASAIQSVPGATSPVLAAAQYAVKATYGQGFRLIYLVSIAFGGCAMVAAAFTKNMDDVMTDELNVTLNKAKLPAVTHKGPEGA